jgi:tRNA(adenine34) deaminase
MVTVTIASPQDREFLREALVEAKAAFYAEEVPVGAVVVHGPRIIMRAQNHMVRSGDATEHAEVRALRGAARMLGEERLHECTLYITLEPCAMCAGAIVLSRVGRVVFSAWDDKAGMAGSVGDLLRHPRLNHRPEVLGGIDADPSSELLREFFERARERKKQLLTLE